MTYIAVIEDVPHPHPPKHMAKCDHCWWYEERRHRRAAIKCAAKHTEASGHPTCVAAHDIDWIVAVPDLPKYRARRVLGPRP